MPLIPGTKTTETIDNFGNRPKASSVVVNVDIFFMNLVKLKID